MNKEEELKIIKNIITILKQLLKDIEHYDIDNDLYEELIKIMDEILDLINDN